MPDEKRWFRITREQYMLVFLHTDEYEDAFQFRDWQTVEYLQDDAEEAWKRGPLQVMAVSPDLPPSKITAEGSGS